MPERLPRVHLERERREHPDEVARREKHHAVDELSRGHVLEKRRDDEKRADEGATDEKAPAPGTPTEGDASPTVVVEG